MLTTFPLPETLPSPTTPSANETSTTYHSKFTSVLDDIRQTIKNKKPNLTNKNSFSIEIQLTNQIISNNVNYSDSESKSDDNSHIKKRNSLQPPLQLYNYESNSVSSIGVRYVTYIINTNRFTLKIVTFCSRFTDNCVNLQSFYNVTCVVVVVK